MFDKIAAVLSVVALGAASFAVYKTSNIPNKEPSTSDQVIESYLHENPQSIIASLENYERQSRESSARLQAERDVELIAEYRTELFNDGYSHISGNPDGDVTLVEFLDYNCGYCKRAHGEVQALMAEDQNIRYVVKEFPILGPGSVTAGRAVLASNMQGNSSRYDAFSDALMSYKGSHSETSVMKIAEEVGLDISRLKDDMKSSKVDQMIERTHSLAQMLGINGTPAFVVGDTIVRGYVPADRLQELADAARSG